MSPAALKICEQIKTLPDLDKAELINEILAQLDIPDQRIHRAWEEEVGRRIEAAEAGQMDFIPYEEVMGKFSRRCRSAFERRPTTIS